VVLASGDIANAIRSFPRIRWGLDAHRPESLKGLTAPFAADLLLEALTSFVFLVLDDKVPAKFCPIFFGAFAVGNSRCRAGGLPRRSFAPGRHLRYHGAFLYISWEKDLGVELVRGHTQRERLSPHVTEPPRRS